MRAKLFDRSDPGLGYRLELLKRTCQQHLAPALGCLDIGALCVSKTPCFFRRCFSCKKCQADRDHGPPRVLAFRTARLADRGRTPFQPISGGAGYPWLGKMDDWPRERMEPRPVKNRGGIGAGSGWSNQSRHNTPGLEPPV